MRVPLINTVCTFLKDGSTDFTAHQLDANGRIRVNVGTTVQPTVMATPPASPGNGDLWYNTAVGWGVLMVYDAARSFWLSTFEIPYVFGHDNTDNAPLRNAVINNAGTGSGHRIPLDAMITRISAKARTGFATKSFNILTDGSNGAAILSSFSLVGGVFVDNNVSQNLTAGQDLWIDSDAPGGSSTDITVDMFVRWRVAP